MAKTYLCLGPTGLPAYHGCFWITSNSFFPTWSGLNFVVLWTGIIIVENNFLDSIKIRDYICACDIVIQPYIKASQSGITPVSYYYETPLIVSNVKGLKEIIKRDNSGEVFDKTSENLSKAIINSLKNDNQETYKANIRKSKTEYTWSRFIQELEKI